MNNEASRAGREIIIVDDDDQIVRIISDVVAEDGFVPVGFDDSRRALEYVRARRPALIITDMRLPAMTGQEFVQQVRRELGSDLPIAVMTGLEPTSSELREMGVQAFLPKPFEIDDLLGIVDQWASLG